MLRKTVRLSIILICCSSGAEPDEIVRGFVKRAVGPINMVFKLSHVEELTKEHLKLITHEMFDNYHKHALKEELKYKELS